MKIVNNILSFLLEKIIVDVYKYKNIQVIKWVIIFRGQHYLCLRLCKVTFHELVRSLTSAVFCFYTNFCVKRKLTI